MNQKITRYVHAGRFAAAVEIEDIPDDGAWGPYISFDDAMKLERVQKALAAGDLKAAGREARVYEMTPVAAE